jgi:hypothetical protein
MTCHQWDKAVAAKVEGVNQPIGTPISDSMNRGFRSAVFDPYLPFGAVVGSRGECPKSRKTRSNNVEFVAFLFGAPCEETLPVGVGHCDKPEPLPMVRGTNILRGIHTPFRIEPEVGKVGEDVGEPIPNQSGHVLQEDESRSHITDDSGNGRPKPPVVFDSSSGTGSGERLTRKARSDDVHTSTPCCAIEGLDIVPQRSAIQDLFFHPRHENGCCVGIPLTTTHGSYVETGKSKSKFEAAVSVA